MPGVFRSVSETDSVLSLAAPGPSFAYIAKERSVCMTKGHSPVPSHKGLRLKLRQTRRESVWQSVLDGLNGQSFTVDRDADTMALIGALALAKGLSLQDIQQLKEFGQGFNAPWLTVAGLPAQDNLPETPQGYGDDTEVLFSDSILLGGMMLAGLSPIAYSYENYGRLMRNVAPSKLAENTVSSHGAKLALEWHTDNAYAFQDGFRSPRSTGTYTRPMGSPSPRFLCFVALRNQEANGNPVPTELLAVDEILSQLPVRLIDKLRQPIYEIKPGSSNKRTSMRNMPLLESCPQTGVEWLRFNANEGRTLGRSKLAQRAVAEMTQRIEQMDSSSIPIYLEAGELLMFDNYRVLHRRKAFDPGELAHARWLRRCFGTTEPASGQYVDREHRPYVWL